MFLHLITMCVGLIIAFGLQQIVEFWQRRRRIHKARDLDLQAQRDHVGPPDLP